MTRKLLTFINYNSRVLIKIGLWGTAIQGCVSFKCHWFVVSDCGQVGITVASKPRDLHFKSQSLANFFERIIYCAEMIWSTKCFFKKNLGQPGLLFVYFRSFQKHYNFYNKYMWKNVHPVYGAGIQTHNLRNCESLPITTRPGLPPKEHEMFNHWTLRSRISQ